MTTDPTADADATHRRAALLVAQRSRTPEEQQDLLEMLGLVEAPEIPGRWLDALGRRRGI